MAHVIIIGETFDPVPPPLGGGGGGGGWREGGRRGGRGERDRASHALSTTTQERYPALMNNSWWAGPQGLPPVLLVHDLCARKC